MDTFYVLAILLSTLVFIIIPVSFIGLIYFLFKRKASKRLAISVTVTLISIFLYYLFTNFYPRDSFYTDNLKENTGMTLPKSARLIGNSGVNSIYNFGDYNLSYMYQLNEADYGDIFSQLLDKGFKSTDVYLETLENEKLLSMMPKLKGRKILTKDFGYKNFDILFLDDNKTVVFNSSKW